MLSRVADSLYWMSRYLERAEHTTRLLDVNLNLMLDESATSAERRWQRMLQALGSPKGIEWRGDPYALTRSLTFDTQLKVSIVHCIIQARENSRHVREQISTEQWDRINRLYLQVTRPGESSGEPESAARLTLTLPGASAAMGPSATQPEPTEFLQQVMEGVHQFQGVSDSTMSHGEGWHFIQVGRYIERAAAIAMLLEAYNEDLWGVPSSDVAAGLGVESEPVPERHSEGNEYLEWMGLLRSATAFEAYCKVYTADLTPERIFEFLLLDEEFPHSLRFSINALQQALQAIDASSASPRAEKLRRIAGRLHASLSYSSVDEILERDVIAYLRGILAQCRELHNNLYTLYIDYSIQAALAG